MDWSHEVDWILHTFCSLHRRWEYSINLACSFVGGGSDGSGKITFLCPKCGDICTHVESLVCKFALLRECYKSLFFNRFDLASTRFIKCEKCSHFFVVLSDNEGQKKIKEDKVKKRQPLPSPKKVDRKNASLRRKPVVSFSKIFAFLDKYIVGQEHAKKVMAVAVYNHYKRLHNNMSLNKPSKNSSDNALPNISSQQRGTKHSVSVWFRFPSALLCFRVLFLTLASRSTLFLRILQAILIRVITI